MPELSVIAFAPYILVFFAGILTCNILQWRSDKRAWKWTAIFAVATSLTSGIAIGVLICTTMLHAPSERWFAGLLIAYFLAGPLWFTWALKNRFRMPPAVRAWFRSHSRRRLGIFRLRRVCAWKVARVTHKYLIGPSIPRRWPR